MRTTAKPPVCRKCNTELTEENWYLSHRDKRNRICKECDNKRRYLWRNAHLDKEKASWTSANRKRGMRPFDENKDCAQFLGIHVAERVLSHVFKDVKRMPMHNPGYDIICNQKKLIDIKSSCTRKVNRRGYMSWMFQISRNTIADFFLCLAFDNREDLNPLHAWLIPGDAINHLMTASISPSPIHKWDKYRLDTSKVSACCDELRHFDPKP